MDPPVVPPGPDEFGKHVQMMSAHSLINNPGTLTAGVMQLHKQITATVKSDNESNKGYSSTDSSASFNTRSRRNKRRGGHELGPVAAPVTDQKPPAPARSSGPKKIDVEEDDVDDLLSVCSSSGSTCGRLSEPDVARMSEVESQLSDSESGEKEKEDKESSVFQQQGQAQFVELLKRFDMNTTKESTADSSISKINKEFDLNASGVLMRSVFQDYENKERLYAKHSKKVQELTPSEAVKQFELIKPALWNIMEGRLESLRMNLFLSEDERDVGILKSLSVSSPFTTTIYMEVANLIMDTLFKKSSRQLYMNYIRLVLIPEALIRLYSNVNDLDLSHAETEMKFGPQYDGPLPKSLRRKGKSRRNRSQSVVESKRSNAETVTTATSETASTATSEPATMPTSEPATAETSESTATPMLEPAATTVIKETPVRMKSRRRKSKSGEKQRSSSRLAASATSTSASSKAGPMVK